MIDPRNHKQENNDNFSPNFFDYEKSRSRELMNRENELSENNNVTPDTEDLNEAEDNVNFVNNFKPKSIKKSKTFLKLSPTAGLIGGLGFGGIIVGIVTSVLSLMPIHIKEIITNKFNTQLASLDARTNKIISSKINGTTSGLCTKKISVLCKYSSMSDKQIERFKDAGIKVNADADSSTITGRTKPTSFEYDGKTISASEFMSKYKQDINFKNAVYKSYNPKYAGLSDFIWKKAANKLKINKQAVDIDGKNDEERLKKIQDKVNDSKDGSKANKKVKAGDDNGKGGTYTEEEAKKINQATDTANEIADNADEIANSKIKSGTEALEIAEKSIKDSALDGLGKIVNVVKITGVADDACMAYGTIQAVGYAAKTVRALQLARFAMIFLNVADQIKAGTAKAADVEYLGKILTTTKPDSKEKKGLKSATDSYGYKYAAYGEAGKMPVSASQFLAAGGLTGSLIGVTKAIDSATGGKPRQVCKILGNPIVGLGSIVIGIAGLILAPQAIAFKDVAQVIGSIALTAATYVLPAMLQDIIAGVLIDKNTVGELAGNAYASGAGYLMGSTAALGGNAPLTPIQAASYGKLTASVLSEYDELERLNNSQLNIASTSTFAGKLFSQLIPYTSSISSFSNVFSSIASISIGSINLLNSQVTYASSNVEDYQVCQDLDYMDPNADGDKSDRIATDPFCNIIYGIPPASLDKDPIEVAQYLIDKEEINENGDIIGEDYKEFMKNCINRERPMGDVGSDGSEDDGSMCLFDHDPDNEYYYLYHIDQRVDKGMDGIESGGGTSSTADVKIDVANLYNDSTSVACAPGTTDAGTADGYTDGNLVKIRLCSLPGTLDNDENLGSPREATVNSRVSGAWLALINEMKTAVGESTIGVASSFRTMEMQEADKAKYGGGAATPGYSNHQMGLAIDFDTLYGSSSWGKGEKPYYDFLKHNGGGAKYGFNQIDSEAWHWEPIH